MAKMYFDDDADLSFATGDTVCIVGFGNQGRSQALNLRDSGVNVIVGSQRDPHGLELLFPMTRAVLDVGHQERDRPRWQCVR